jgi:uncharacterized Zn finger protein (UPF0148 family)
MSILKDTLARARRNAPVASPALTTPVPQAPGGSGHSAPIESAPTAPGGSAPPAFTAPPGDRSELRRRRDALAQEVTELHWDLGGLTYEMAIRDHFRLDVLVRRAAKLQERDAELAEVERLLLLEENVSVAACPGCGAPHSRGAVYCWQCGQTLMQRAPSGSERSPQAEPDETTAVLDALLAPNRAARHDGGDEQRRAFSEE